MVDLLCSPFNRIVIALCLSSPFSPCVASHCRKAPCPDTICGSSCLSRPTTFNSPTCRRHLAWGLALNGMAALARVTDFENKKASLNAQGLSFLLGRTGEMAKWLAYSAVLYVRTNTCTSTRSQERDLGKHHTHSGLINQIQLWARFQPGKDRFKNRFEHHLLILNCWLKVVPSTHDSLVTHPQPYVDICTEYGVQYVLATDR